MILLIDNYDSFVHNLARYFRQLGCVTQVLRNDVLTIEQVVAMRPEAIVISPGPCTPDQAGISLEIVARLAGSIPILGICLGHQAIVQALGGSIIVSHRPMHGRESELVHWGSPMFVNIPSPFRAGRYHSLIADRERLPDCLKVTARTDDFTIMAVEHESYPVVGLQFHPESILTEHGHPILENFLKVAGVVRNIAMKKRP
jgi:anthranilate synthase/aminodeoxychorismate synthase-like glutamine amidotransferase